MRPPIRFRCTSCNARIKAPREMLGQVRACPSCGRRFVIQTEKPADSDPLLVPGDWLGFVPSFAALIVSSSAIYALRGRTDVVRAMWRGSIDGLRALANPRRSAPPTTALPQRPAQVGG